MISRPLWDRHLRRAWSAASLVWLNGVRRVGKTTLVKDIPDALYLNCDLPRIEEMLRDPERFYSETAAGTIIFDEIHQLPDPSRVLKIGTDEFPHLKLLATGSSTMAATKRFRDSLAGRKRVVHLQPVLFSECAAFGVPDVRKRLCRGGLPQPLLSAAHDPTFYAEWLDSYFARDIQELFTVGNRQGFLRLAMLLFRTSGRLLEVTSLSQQSGVSRPTTNSYLDVMQTTHLLRLVRPYHAGGRGEILKQPKAYVFDTGFVAHANGWEDLRDDECGLLWEHVVLDTLQATLPEREIGFWRDKQRREIDFVLPGSRGTCHAVECRWSVDAFSAKNLAAFRAHHPEGRNFLVVPFAPTAHVRRYGDLDVTVCTPAQWAETMKPEQPDEGDQDGRK